MVVKLGAYMFIKGEKAAEKGDRAEDVTVLMCAWQQAETPGENGKEGLPLPRL